MDPTTPPKRIKSPSAPRPLGLAGIAGRRQTDARIGRMPSPTEVEAWKRRNEAVRDADRAADRERPMSQLLEETARLSRAVSELRAGVERASDVRPA